MSQHSIFPPQPAAMQLHKSLLAECVPKIEPCDIFNMLFYLPDSDVVPQTTLSTYTNTNMTEGESTSFLFFCLNFRSVMNTLIWLQKLSCSQQVFWYHDLIVCAVLSTHDAFCSASDMGPLTSLPTQADTTMIQGNSHTLCFIFFYYWHTKPVSSWTHTVARPGTIHFPSDPVQ